MELSNFQRKAVILIFISILIGAILLARKEPLKTPEVIQPSKPTTQVKPIPTKIDINTADISLIMQLPGIGPGLAKGIIRHRPFRTIDDLLKVPGIGEKRLARIKEMIDLPEAPSPIPLPGAPASAGRVSGDTSITKIDLNKATTEQLLIIPGIGPTLAQAIIDYREKNSRFNSLEELIYVPRIGQKTYEKLKGYLYVEICEVGPRTSVRAYDSRIDPKVKCPYCGKQLWEKGRKKTSYIRCPHCLRLLNE